VAAVTDYFTSLRACFDSVEASDNQGPCPVDKAFGTVLEWLKLTARHTIHLIGNGGSASLVAHAQNDLAKACGIRALVHQDLPSLTAYANDHGYPHVYADPLDLWLSKGDALIAVSSSGASENILAAARLARARGTFVVTYSGFAPDNALRQMGQVNFYVPSTSYGHVEVTHAALLHCLTDRLAIHA
jgi:D-sedoheptulose 7-phosphate isomerase